MERAIKNGTRGSICKWIPANCASAAIGLIIALALLIAVVYHWSHQAAHHILIVGGTFVGGSMVAIVGLSMPEFFFGDMTWAERLQHFIAAALCVALIVIELQEQDHPRLVDDRIAAVAAKSPEGAYAVERFRACDDDQTRCVAAVIIGAEAHGAGFKAKVEAALNDMGVN